MASGPRRAVQGELDRLGALGEDRLRVIVRKSVDLDGAPIMWVELPDGSAVSLGGRGHGRIKSRAWSQQMFAEVALGDHPSWELIA